MPTGYTSDINDSTTFEKFAMGCARAFGALIMMRDDPSDAPIPPQMAVDYYYPAAVAAAEARLRKLIDMDEAEADKRAREEYDTEKARRKSRGAEDVKLRANYERMLAAARAWKPPTPDHENMRDFMIEQLTSSIKFDCHTDAEREKWEPALRLLTATTWRALRIGDAERQLESARETLAKEEKRNAERNAWVSALRESLAP